MKLEQLRTNIIEMTDEESVLFMTEYTLERANDLLLQYTPVYKPQPERKPKEKKVAVTPEQLELLQKLGLV